MTIAITIKVNDGIVLASDSAGTLTAFDPKTNTQLVLNIYNNANKIFNLIKGYPIGMISWGAASIGDTSIETISEDFD